MQTATVTTNANNDKITLQWDQTTQWASFPELGSIYTQEMRVDSVGDYHYIVDFRVGDGRRSGILFASVKHYENSVYVQTMHYYLGQFTTNARAMMFAQFAFNNFLENENWMVCPSFQPIDLIDGDPYFTFTGEEVVSDSL